MSFSRLVENLFHPPCSGADLRRLYLPGLEGLKEHLRMFEWLLERLLPDVKRHLDVRFLRAQGLTWGQKKITLSVAILIAAQCNEL